MAAEEIGKLYSTKMPGYEDPADIQEALKLYHYGSSTYDPLNTDNAQLLANSIAGHLDTLANSVIFLDARGIGSIYSNTQPIDPADGFIWMNASETGSQIASYAVAIYTNDPPTENLVDGIIWVDKDSSPIKAYVYDSLQEDPLNPMAAWIPLTELYNIVDAAGDLIYGTAPDDFERLPIGSTGDVLTVSSGLPVWSSPKKWTQVATGSLAGSSVSITGLNGEKLYIAITDWSHNDTVNPASLAVQFNEISSPVYVRTNGITTGSALLTPTFSHSVTPDLAFAIDLANTSAQLKTVSTVSYDSSTQYFGYFKNPAAINSIRITLSSGEFDNGTYYVWSYS